MYRSLYNVFDDKGQLIIAPGDAIDVAEAMRQAIIPPLQEAIEVLASVGEFDGVSTAHIAETQGLEQPSATVERQIQRER